jgi:Uri superfamily endonuclease
MPQGLNLVRIDKNGKIIESLQSTDKKVTSVSDIVFLDGYYYLGSAHNNFLGRVKAK